MTTKEFIEKAISGGWGNGSRIDFFSPVSPWDGTTYFRGKENVQWSMHLNAILLDPLAWQAVGKVERWEKEFLYSTGEWVRTYSSNPEDLDELMNFVEKDITEWKYHMHRMVDALCEGKTIDEFLKIL